MSLVVSDAGETRLLDRLLSQGTYATYQGYILKLWQAPTGYTPSSSTVSADFTQANFTNYVAATLTRANWNAAQTVLNQAQASYGSAAISWTCGTTGNTIYGYWVESQEDGYCLWAEKFAVARALGSGDVLNLVPQFSLSSAT